MRLLIDRASMPAKVDDVPARVTHARGRAWQLPPVWTGLLAASLIAAVATTAWLAVRHASLVREIDALRSQGGGLQVLAPPASVAPQPSPSTPPVDPAGASLAPVAQLTVPLSAGMLRDGGTLARVDVPSQASTVRFRLALQGDVSTSYRALLYDAELDDVSSASKMKAPPGDATRELFVVMPADLLHRGDFEIRLRGIDPRGREQIVATYRFRVTSARF
jgi:hypothetical protein